MEKQKPMIIFDVGGILIDLNYGKDENSFFAHASSIADVSKDEFRSWYSNLERSCLLGHVDAQEHYKELRKKLNRLDMPQDELEELVGLLWTGQIDKTVELKQELHKNGYQIGLLSNMTDFALDILSRKHPRVFDTWGGRKVYSFEEDAIKPNSKLYHAFDDVPGPKLFIDDNRNYVETSVREFGWMGIHYTYHIDEQEGIRHAQGTVSSDKNITGLFVANNPQQLVSALRECSVNL